MKNKNLILALSLLMISLISFGIGVYLNWSFKTEFYLGCFLLLTSIFVFLKFKNNANSLFGIVLILGLLNIIHFTPYSVGISFTLFKIDVISLLFLIIYYSLNSKKINSKVLTFIASSKTDVERQKNNKIDFFKNQFKHLSESEINTKLNENLVSEAIEALLFLKEKKTDNDK